MPSLENLAHPIGRRLADSRGEPASQVIADELWFRVVSGELESGERLPTPRELAVALGLNPRSVGRAYRALQDRGVVVTRAGEGTFVSLHPPREQELERSRAFAELCQQAYDRAVELGFGVDDLLDALAEYRSADRGGP